MPAAFSALSTRQTQRSMYTTFPVDYKYDLVGLLVDIYHYLADERP